MLKKILLALGLLALIFVGVVAMQPADYTVIRTASIPAAPPALFGYLNDFHKWDAWSPWAKLDPNMKQTYEGSPAGTGAVYSWSGDGKVGAGKMTLLESKTNELVRIKLERILKGLLSPTLSSAEAEERALSLINDSLAS